MPITSGETWKMDRGTEIAASENIALLRPARPAEESSTLVRTASFGLPEAPARQTALEAIPVSLSSRPASPLSTPLKAPAMPQANANSGGGGVSRNGASTPNAGMGGGGPTGGGGGGSGQTNANQFVGVNFGVGPAFQPDAPLGPASQPNAPVGPASQPDHLGSTSPAGKPALPSPLTDFQTTYSMTPPTQASVAYEPMSGTISHGHGHHHKKDPLYVLDMNTGETLPANTTLNTFSTWAENLMAQVSGVTVSSYLWNVSQAPDFAPTTGLTGYNLQGTWNSFTGAARTDIISVTETPTMGMPLTQTMVYLVSGTNSPAFSSSRPTSSGTWSNVLTPDTLSADQATGNLGPYASYGLADGSAQTSFAMPSYNPNVAPLGLVYDSTAAAVDPAFVVHYQWQGSPSAIQAQLSIDNIPGPTITYNVGSNFNPGDWMQFTLQENTLGNNIGLSTGRYPWSITLSNYGSPLTTYSGNVDIVNQSSSPFGAGWSLDGVEQLLPVSGGVMIVDAGGTSLFFAGSGGSYTSPAGDFSTLVQSGGVYTRTMPDGTKINFNSSGQQTSVVDTDGNTTNYNYSGGLLTGIKDMNGQTTTLAYSGGLLTSIIDPAGRTATLAYSGGDLTSITDPGNNLWQYTYNSNGRMSDITDPNNHTSQFDYEAAGLLQGVNIVTTTISYTFVPMEWNGLAVGTSTYATAQLVAFGDQSRFYDANDNAWQTGIDWSGFGQDVQDVDPDGNADLTYLDTNGLPWLSADGLGRMTREFFDGKGNPTEIVYPDSTTEQYQYNGYSEVTQYTDPTGYTTSYTYDNKGNLTQVEDPLLHVTTYAYNAAGLVTLSIDPLNNQTTYGYNTVNELTSVTNALKHTATFLYDSAGDISSSTNPLGYVTTYSYNTLDWLIGATFPDTSGIYSVYTYSYDNVGNMTGEITPLGGALTWGYDVLNRVIGISAPLQGTYSFAYDNDNNLIAVTDPEEGVWSYGYDAAYQGTSVGDPLGDTTSYSYDAAGQTTSVTNPLGYVTSYTYTPRGQVASVTDPLGDVTSYSYNAAGDQTTVSQTGPSSPTYTVTNGYNQLHQLTITTDQLGHSTTYAYDADGNQTSVTDPLGHAVTYGYNALDQMTIMTDALGDQTTYGYDADGNQNSITDPLGHVTTESYDAQGRVLSVTDALGGITSYTYDAMGDEESITDPVGNQTTFAYDTAGRMTSSTDALGATNYSYNELNQLVLKTDADGRATSYTYDQAGHEINEQWLNSFNQPIYTATYTYDKAGELTAASDPYSSYSYTYDQVGRQTSVSNAGTPGVPTVTLSFGYDVFDNRTSLSDSLGGSISYSFDGANRLNSLGLSLNGTLTAKVTMGYDNADRLTGLTRTTPSVSGDTITTSYVYDNADRLTNIKHTDTTKALTLANYTYGYDKASELTSYQDNNNSSLTYGYDKTGQLLSAKGTLNGSTYSVSYSYDLNGNRTMTGYKTGADNELTSDGVYNYTYDNDGNTLTQTNIATGTVTYYTWDYRNRLTEVEVEDKNHNVLNDEKFTYDVENNRIGVSLNGTQQLYTVYDGANPYMDFNGTGTLTERYLTNPESLNEFYGQVNASGTTQWLLTDNINSIRQVISASGGVLDRITYDPYGSLVTQTSMTYEPRFLFTGGAYDALTGTYQDGEREDNPADGRWLSQDPSGLEPDSNPYRYVGNNPTNVIDPTGLWKIKRENQPYAKAISDRGDTIRGLARIVRLDPSQWEQWLSRDFGLESKVTLANGTKKSFWAKPTSLKVDDRLAAGQELRVPNTIVMIWLGELRGYGKVLSGWSGDYQYLYRRGFRVKELLFNTNDAITDIHDTIIKTFNEELRHMDKGQTYGIYVIGHGSKSGFGRKNQGYEEAITYDELKNAIGYQLGLGIFNVCNGAFGRRIVYLSGFFYGIYGLFIPQPFPFNDTKHPSDILKPGKVGTIK